MALLVARVREDPLLLTALALFFAGERQSALLVRQLSLDAQRAELDVKYCEIESHVSSLTSALVHYSFISTAPLSRGAK